MIDQQQQHNQEANSQVQIDKQQQIDISFQNLHYQINISKKQSKKLNILQGNKVILNNVSGIFKHGEVSAILGSSGAGKTTLINILCCRIQNSNECKVSGKVLSNNIEYNQVSFSNFGSYVMQDDRLIEALTVRESLQFAANLRSKGTSSEKEQIVKRIIKQLQLDRCIDTLIGGFFIQGVSGGERKRASIGFELVTNPSVLFLDEPTSGLDSFTAYKVVKPSSDIWNLFDRIFLIVQGQFIYQGPGQDQILKYFENLGYKCPQFSNPADYFISIMHKIPQNINNYESYFKNYREILEKQVQIDIDNRLKSVFICNKVINSCCYEIAQITKRAIIQMKRNPYMAKIRFIQSIVLALLAGILFWKVPDGRNNPGDQRSLWDRFGFFMFSIIIIFQTTVGPVVLTFPLERGVFLKEENSKLYKTISYFIGRSLTDIPYLFLVPLIFSCITYWMTGLNDSKASNFFTFFLVLFVLALTGNSVGLLAGCAFPEQKATPGIMPMILMPLMLFSGFFSNRSKYPVYIGWLEYISPLKYSFEALVTNEFQEQSYFIPNPIKQLGLSLGLWNSIGILICLFLFFRGWALLFLMTLKKKVQ